MKYTNLPQPIPKRILGIAINRQPGATGLWVTSKYDVWHLPNGLIFKLGDPLRVSWFKEGREATREEVLESINSGYPILLEAAQIDGAGAVKKLEEMRDRALELLPVTVTV
ncbi:hypothetical protein [Nostoc punctiforme]|uniref:Uncharacterized protein n=1 Tax=Nostoc punctiforme (strain ATCC 29133 / PCC 73102) TaxID=63737 RepID=B2J9U7_NOSP7|nr:hypothetical protein [Nostoc punctiforme]ACC81124.1 hypothetical protein Npun_F2570 [Nostoc punctiforme PCC 73102]